MDAAVMHVDNRLEPYKSSFIREINRDDILRLMEIKMARILRFNSDKADELIAKLLDDIDEINHNLDKLVDYTISWYLRLKERYGKTIPPERPLFAVSKVSRL